MATILRVSVSELADVLGLTPRRIAQLAAEGMPPNRQGYDLAACCRWYIEKLRSDAAAARRELVQGRARLAQAKAEREELELAALRGELVDAEEVRRTAFAAARTARDVLLGIPARIAPLVIGAEDQHEVIRILTDEMRRVCAELAAIKLPNEGKPPQMQQVRG